MALCKGSEERTEGTALGRFVEGCYGELHPAPVVSVLFYLRYVCMHRQSTVYGRTAKMFLDTRELKVTAVLSKDLRIC